MTRRDDFAVGLTVLVTVVLVTVALAWANQSDLGRPRRDLVARFRDVGNVRVGAHVVIRGVRAGRVEALTLAPDGWVEARLALDPAAELPPRPVVLLNEASLFGEWQATVLGRDALPRDPAIARQVADADRGGGRVPGATLPDIAQLTAVAGRIAGDVATVAERVGVAFDERAARELRASIRHVADLSAALAQTVRAQSRNLDTVAVEVRTGAQALRAASHDVRSVAARVDSSTARGEVGRIVGDAAAAARHLREAGERLEVLAGQLGAAEARLRVVLARGDSILGKVNRGEGSLGLLVNDPSLYRAADTALRDLQALLQDVRRNPRRYVHVRIF